MYASRKVFSFVFFLTAFWFLSFHTANSGADSINRGTDVITSRDSKCQTRDSIIFEAPYLHNGAR